MARTALILSIVSAVIILSLIGVVIFESLQKTNQEPPVTNGSTNGAFGNAFFVRDPQFNTPTIPSSAWGVESWNKNPESISQIENGVLHLFYNEKTSSTYGNSGAFQGRHPADDFTNQSLLVGTSSQGASSSEYVVFPKNLSIGKFWVKTRFKIDRMGFNSLPSAVNLGITLMCAVNNQPFSNETQPLWLDLYFSGYILTRTSILTLPKDTHYVNENQTDGIHAGYYVGEVHPRDFGKWVELSADLGDYISKTLNLITQVQIETIRVYGFILFVECTGAYAEAEYDYVETYVT
jgi:hypothetical protein